MDYIATNRNSWNESAKIHFDSKMYDIPGFLNGGCKLKEIELAALTDAYVKGKKLLHLQCHFGLDTLSWARRGAEVTGVDLSPVAIDKARELAMQCKLQGQATFICQSVDEYAETAQPEYDVVFVSYGALCWLPDIKNWAKAVSNSLKAGGKLVLVEFHPCYQLHHNYPYFDTELPDVYQSGTYTENCPGVEHTYAHWSHSLATVLDAIISSGIQINSFGEYPFSPYDCFEDLEEKEPGRFYVKDQEQEVPLIYSVTGTKL